jgi:FkbM family methyltransferase
MPDSPESNPSHDFLSKLRWKLCLPEYLLRPRQIVRRLQRKLGTLGSSETVRLPWGLNLTITPPELIFNALWFKGIYDLVASETIWRLVDEGDVCLDIGAHVGYMSSIMAMRAGRSGSVTSFEPHPILFRELEANIDQWRESGIHSVAIKACALSDTNGFASLRSPSDWKQNRGAARLLTNDSGQPDGDVETHAVSLRRLDDLLGPDARVGLAKIDVESHEVNVLRGAERLLERHAIRDIVFEDLGKHPTATMTLLKSQGYSVFSLAKQFRGPLLGNADRRGASPRDDPNYLATVEPERAQKRMERRGWSVLHEA